MAPSLLFLLLLALHTTPVPALSPPPQDPEWPGWWCGGSYFGQPGVKCAKLLTPHTITATPSEAGPLCAALKRDGDLFTPHLLIINSKEDEDLAISSIMWGAYLWEGGNIGVWVGPSTYRDSKLPPWGPPAAFVTSKGANSTTNSTQSSSTSTISLKSGDSSYFNSSWYGHTPTRVRRSSSSRNTPECGELRIEVASHGSHGQPSGYGFNPSTVSWAPKLCRERSRIVCQTRKLTVSGLMGTLNRQTRELELLSEKVANVTRELDAVKSSHCGVEPKHRVECGWGGIKAWQCRQRGCCFDASITGVKWCFKKVQDSSKFV